MEPGNRQRKKTPLKIRLLLGMGIFFLLSLSAVFPPTQPIWEQAYQLAGLGAPKCDGLLVQFLNVGSADAAIIHTEDTTILLDAGTVDCGRKIYHELQHLGVEKIDLAINTHPDADHIGGFAEVLNRIPVAEYWSPVMPEGWQGETEEYRLVSQAISSHKVPVKNVLAGDTFSKDGIQLEVLSPQKPEKTDNDNSLVIRMTYHRKSILWMGDAEASVEEKLIAQNIDLDCDILKVGHHGSNTSTTAAFLKKASPEFAVISCGARRPPSQEVINRLESFGAQTFCTDVSGTIRFYFETEGIRFDMQIKPRQGE